MTASQAGPLAGMKVIELAHIMAGPVCGLMLADMGADVIKVEKMPGGDDTRRMLPPDIDGESAAFMILNRNKRGTAINLKQPEGKAALRKLLDGADVVIENYRPGTMQRLGLGYDELRQTNPGLIYCQITGFGRTGPYAGRAGFDLISQGMSGLMGLTGEGPGRPPVKVGVPVGDVTAGILAAMAIQAAYINRLRTGEGQWVDTSLLEASLIHTYWPAAIFLATGASPGAMGTAHPISAPYQSFRTADGWVNVGAANQANWLRLLEVLGAESLASDPRFDDNRSRRTNLQELVDELTPLFEKRTTQDWLQRLEAGGVPAGPVWSIGEALTGDQAQAREMVIDVQHQRLGTVKAVGAPVKFSDTPVNRERGAPVYGQHTREVFAEIGYSDAEIDALVAQGATVVAGPERVE